MVVSRYIGGREVSVAELNSITITNNNEIGAAINRVVARINSEVQPRIVSTTHIPTRKDVVKISEI